MPLFHKLIIFSLKCSTTFKLFFILDCIDFFKLHEIISEKSQSKNYPINGQIISGRVRMAMFNQCHRLCTSWLELDAHCEWYHPKLCVGPGRYAQRWKKHANGKPRE